MSSESRTPDKKFETNRTLVLMLTVYSGVCIYSGRHMLLTQATSEWCRLPTTTHPNSRQIVAGRPDECKKIILRPLLAGILTLKHCSRMHQNTSFSVWKRTPLGGYGASTRTPSALGLDPSPPLQNPRYATANRWCCQQNSPTAELVNHIYDSLRVVAGCT